MRRDRSAVREVHVVIGDLDVVGGSGDLVGGKSSIVGNTFRSISGNVMVVRGSSVLSTSRRKVRRLGDDTSTGGSGRKTIVGKIGTADTVNNLTDRVLSSIQVGSSMTSDKLRNSSLNFRRLDDVLRDVSTESGQRNDMGRRPMLSSHHLRNNGDSLIEEDLKPRGGRRLEESKVTEGRGRAARSKLIHIRKGNRNSGFGLSVEEQNKTNIESSGIDTTRRAKGSCDKRVGGNVNAEVKAANCDVATDSSSGRKARSGSGQRQEGSAINRDT